MKPHFAFFLATLLIGVFCFFILFVFLRQDFPTSLGVAIIATAAGLVIKFTHPFLSRRGK